MPAHELDVQYRAGAPDPHVEADDSRDWTTFPTAHRVNSLDQQRFQRAGFEANASRLLGRLGWVPGRLRQNEIDLNLRSHSDGLAVENGGRVSSLADSLSCRGHQKRVADQDPYLRHTAIDADQHREHDLALDAGLPGLGRVYRVGHAEQFGIDGHPTTPNALRRPALPALESGRVKQPCPIEQPLSESRAAERRAEGLPEFWVPGPG